MKKVNCNICNSQDPVLLITKNSFNVVRCRNCGLVYVNPMPEPEELNKIYASKGNGFDNRQEREILLKFEIVLQMINKLNKDKGTLLDVGCSTGQFLNMARDSGWDTYGIDIDEQIIEFAKARYKLKVQRGDLIGANFPDSHFDVITFLDTIEHVQNPLRVLQKAERILKQKGLILLSTPNINGLFPQITYNLFARTIGAWEHPTPPKHLFQFSKNTLSKLLKKAKLEVVSFKSFEIPRHYTAEKLESAIIDSIKGSFSLFTGTQSRINGEYLKNFSDDESSKIHRIHSLPDKLKKILPRIAIKGLSWALVLSIYPVASFFNMGDSIIIAARKG